MIVNSYTNIRKFSRESEVSVQDVQGVKEKFEFQEFHRPQTEILDSKPPIILNRMSLKRVPSALDQPAIDLDEIGTDASLKCLIHAL